MIIGCGNCDVVNMIWSKWCLGVGSYLVTLLFHNGRYIRSQFINQHGNLQIKWNLKLVFEYSLLYAYARFHTKIGTVSVRVYKTYAWVLREASPRLPDARWRHRAPVPVAVRRVEHVISWKASKWWWIMNDKWWSPFFIQASNWQASSIR